MNKKKIFYLTTSPSLGHPTDQGHSLPQSLSLAVGYVQLDSPLSWNTPLVLHQTTLWARGSSLSSQAKVTSGDSHCEIYHSPGAKVNV